MKYLCLTIILCFAAMWCFGQSDSILRNEPVPDTVFVYKLLIEPAKVVYPKYIVKKNGHWYAGGRRVEIILYKLRDGISDEWYHWPD